MSKLAFPGMRSWQELFTFTTDDKAQAPPPVIWHNTVPKRRSKGTRKHKTNIGPLCSIRGHKPWSLWVTPSEAVIAHITSTMLVIENDSIYFEAIVQDHRPAETLVVAQYNLIIGSRWLARINTDTVPFLKTEEVICG